MLSAATCENSAQIKLIVDLLVKHSLLRMIAGQVECRAQQRGDSHETNCAALTMPSIDRYIDHLRAYKFGQASENVQKTIKAGMSVYSQQSDQSTRSARSECQERFPTALSIQASWIEEVCRVFPGLASIQFLSGLTGHLYCDQLVIVVNQLPVISDVLALVVAKDNPLTYLTVSLQFGRDLPGFSPLLADGQPAWLGASLQIRVSCHQTDVVRHSPTILQASLISKAVTIGEVVQALLD